MNITEKILAKASGNKVVKAGEIVIAKVDKAMMDDILGPRVEIAEKLKELNLNIWDKDKVVLISDHYTPPANAKQAEIVKFTRDWADEYEIEKSHPVKTSFVSEAIFLQRSSKTIRFPLQANLIKSSIFLDSICLNNNSPLFLIYTK